MGRKAGRYTRNSAIQRVYEYIERKDGVCIDDISRYLGINKQSVRVYVSRLMRDDYIVKENFLYYQIKKRIVVDSSVKSFRGWGLM